MCAGISGSPWRRWGGSTRPWSPTPRISRPGPSPGRGGRRGAAMPDPRISALVLARDEAHNLPECLAALAWVDERIVVVDPASRDDTEAIARRLADRVLVRPFDDFASQRNAALDLASGEWVFAVDA